MGGLIGTTADTGGSYLTRLQRVSYAAVLDGAAGCPMNRRSSR